MSDHGGKKFKKNSHQWEEAGSEFYQECYNGELDNFNKKNCPITTLLPSKQFRIGTTRKSQDGAKTKLWQSTISTTQKKYIKVDNSSQIPDLSEVCTDEESIWEEILQIKLIAINMTQKKELKLNLKKATKLRLQGLNQIRWQRKKIWHHLKETTSRTFSRLELWKNSLKHIESSCGTGVVALFIFVRWIFILNFFTFIVLFILLIFPFYLSNGFCNETCDAFVSKDGASCRGSANSSLFSDYIIYPHFLKCSLFFYGGYSIWENNSTHSRDFSSDSSGYGSSLAFILPIVSVFCFIFLAIAKTAVQEFKEKLIYCKTQLYPYSSIAFGSWDYCINCRKTAIIKQKAIANEFDHILHSKRMYLERYSRSKQYIFELFIIRFFINLLIISLLILSSFCLYIVFDNHSIFKMDVNYNNTLAGTAGRKSNLLDTNVPTNLTNFENFYHDAKIVFLNIYPFVVLVAFNVILPLLFSFLCRFEKYSNIFVIKINLCRSIIVRSSSLAVFILRIYNIAIAQVNSQEEYKSCWELFVGELFYKFIIVDFIIQLLITFCINFPRSFFLKDSRNQLCTILGQQNFEIWKQGLDLIYLQAVCWLGLFYAPFLPLFAAISTFCIFYVKKFQCLVNSSPSKTLCAASDSNSLFMLILLSTFCGTATVLSFAFHEFTPSLVCGPFVGHSSVWDSAIIAFYAAPPFVKNSVDLIMNPKIVISLFFVLCLFIYYYYIKSDANKQMVDVLRNQLVLEGHDKQFLLARLSYFFKHQNQIQNIDSTDQM